MRLHLANHDRIGALRLYLILSFASSFFLWLAFSVNLIFQVEQVGLSPLQLVLVGTVLEASYFLFEVPTGVVADVYSRRLSVILGTFVLGAGAVASAVPSFPVILLANVIMGSGYTFLSGALEAWIADEIGEEHAGTAYLRGAQFTQFGTLVAIPVGVGLATIALNLPIVIGGVLTIVLALVLMLTMPEHGFTPAPREERGSFGAMRDTFLAGAGLVKRSPLLITIFGIAAFFGMFNEGFDRLSPAHLLETFTFPAIGDLQPVVWMGVIQAVALVTRIGLAEIVRRKVDTNSHVVVSRLLLAINGLLVLSVAGFAFAGTFTVAVIAFLIASNLRGITYPLSAAWINQNIDSRVRATVISMSGQADAFGQIAGGPGVGLVGNLFGLRAAMATAGAILIPGLALYARALGQGEQPVIETDEANVTAEG